MASNSRDGLRHDERVAIVRDADLYHDPVTACSGQLDDAEYVSRTAAELLGYEPCQSCIGGVDRTPSPDARTWAGTAEHNTSLVGLNPHERPYIRADTETVVITRSAGSTDGRLHRSDGGLPACDTTRGHATAEYRVVPIVNYPPGWMDWCKYCVAEWRADCTDGGDR